MVILTMLFPFHQVLLDACCSESVIFRCSTTGKYKVSMNSHAIIKDTKLISQLLLAWRVWEKAEKGVWQLLFLALESLIRPDHQNQNFNVTQLQSVNLVENLLMICRVGIDSVSMEGYCENGSINCDYKGRLDWQKVCENSTVLKFICT